MKRAGVASMRRMTNLPAVADRNGGAFWIGPAGSDAAGRRYLLLNRLCRRMISNRSRPTSGLDSSHHLIRRLSRFVYIRAGSGRTTSRTTLSTNRFATRTFHGSAAIRSVQLGRENTYEIH
jgi:hypothetical protein